MTEKDIQQIISHGSTPEIVESQISIFTKGCDYANLCKASTSPDDIITLDESHIFKFDNNKAKLKIMSFIPASGAASRMFKSLFETLDKINIVGEDNFTLDKDDSIQSPFYFFEHIKELAMYDALSISLKKDGYDIENLLTNHKYKTILEYLLTTKGLNYGNTPKALIPFHKEDNRIKAAFEEHICEAVNYFEFDGNITLHYTLSPEHLAAFNDAINKVIPYYEQKYNCHIHVETSVQSPSTDTIAVNPDNTFFRNQDGSLLFRPSGHGALIHNLNDLNADIIIINNIDNVVPDRNKSKIIEYRQLLIEYLYHLYLGRNYILKAIDNKEFYNNNHFVDPMFISFMNQFVHNKLCIYLSREYMMSSDEEKINAVRKMIDRPMRICGMVKNTGEPGGGPFVVKDKKEKRSEQIIESSQIDHNNPAQESIFQSSKYFNPVNIICMTKDYKGDKYDLTKYINKDASFISNKSKDGKPLKALELPGLWNGAMSEWITVFAEVPSETFNPVKTINDLFRHMHL